MHNGGLHCKNCCNYLTKHSSKISKIITGCKTRFNTVLGCLLKPSLADEDAKSMENFCCKQQDYLSPTGKDLKRQVED
eukprot:9471163-Ditylum_brightwellii.AAC.1